MVHCIRMLDDGYQDLDEVGRRDYKKYHFEGYCGSPFCAGFMCGLYGKKKTAYEYPELFKFEYFTREQYRY